MEAYDPVIIQRGRVHHSIPFGGQCPGNNTGQHVCDTEDNLLSINRRK